MIKLNPISNLKWTKFIGAVAKNFRIVEVIHGPVVTAVALIILEVRAEDPLEVQKTFFKSIQAQSKLIQTVIWSICPCATEKL